MKTKVKFFNLFAPVYEWLHFSRPEKLLNFLKAEKLLNKNDKVLDLAGGTGRIGHLVSEFVGKVVVVDASKPMLKECKRKYGLDCRYGHAEKVDFPDNSFDKVLIVDAFHHFQDQSAVIKEIKRILKPNGKVIIEEVNPRKIFGFLLMIAEKIFAMGSSFYQPKDLEKLFLDNFNVKTNLVKNSFYYLVGKIK